MWFNNKYGRYDHLFQDRFKSEIIETEKFMLQCIHYILQDIYNIKKTPKTYIPTHMLNIYIKQYYREEYLTNLIVSKNLKHLQKTLPYLQSIGVLETIKTSASILSLTLEEIKERQVFIESIGEPIVKGNKFNPIFGMIQKRYQKNVKEYEEKKKLIGEIKGAIQEGQELDEQINSKEQSQK